MYQCHQRESERHVASSSAALERHLTMRRLWMILLPPSYPLGNLGHLVHSRQHSRQGSMEVQPDVWSAPRESMQEKWSVTRQIVPMVWTGVSQYLTSKAGSDDEQSTATARSVAECDRLVKSHRRLRLCSTHHVMTT